MNVSEGGDLRGAPTSCSCKLLHSQAFGAQSSTHCAQTSRIKQGPFCNLLFATETMI